MSCVWQTRKNIKQCRQRGEKIEDDVSKPYSHATDAWNHNKQRFVTHGPTTFLFGEHRSLKLACPLSPLQAPPTSGHPRLVNMLADMGSYQVRYYAPQSALQSDKILTHSNSARAPLLLLRRFAQANSRARLLRRLLQTSNRCVIMLSKSLYDLTIACSTVVLPSPLLLLPFLPFQTPLTSEMSRAVNAWADIGHYKVFEQAPPTAS